MLQVASARAQLVVGMVDGVELLGAAALGGGERGVDLVRGAGQLRAVL